MKINTLFFILILLYTGTTCIGQGRESKVFRKGKSLIAAGHGIGNIWKTFLDKAFSLPGYKVTTTGPYTLIYEYGFGKRISAGAAASYSRIKGKYTGAGIAFTDRITIFSILARGNYHFGRLRKFDPYVGIGLGYNYSKYDNSESININSKIPGEFEYSGQLGIKYYVISHLGFYAEAGYVGGSFIQIGLAFSF